MESDKAEVYQARVYKKSQNDVRETTFAISSRAWKNSERQLGEVSLLPRTLRAGLEIFLANGDDVILVEFFQPHQNLYCFLSQVKEILPRHHEDKYS